MTIKIVIHSGCIQASFSREDLVRLALEGSGEGRVRDLEHKPLGKATLSLSPLARAACLEHIDFEIPEDIFEQAGPERAEIEKARA